jgi:hypothetical protein
MNEAAKKKKNALAIVVIIDIIQDRAAGYGMHM